MGQTGAHHGTRAVWSAPCDVHLLWRQSVDHRSASSATGGGSSMNLVSLALRRPISLLVIVLASALLGYLALNRMSRDIFPDLGVPVLYVAQPFGGMDPAQMEGIIVNYYEYHFLYITVIEHVESKSIQGVGLIKLQFHPGTNMAQATAETGGYGDRARAFMPT